MADDDTVHNDRLISRPHMWVILPFIHVLFAVVGGIALFGHHYVRTHPEPSYTVDLSAANASAPVRIEPIGGRVFVWIAGAQTSELRVYEAEDGSLLGTYKYPSAAPPK